MNFRIDARIPLVFGQPADAAPTDALLLEGTPAGAAAGVHGSDWFLPEDAGGHPADCACCGPRSGAAIALARLMLARGRGTGPFFSRVVAVVATEAGRRDVRRALDADPLASACFRLTDP